MEPRVQKAWGWSQELYRDATSRIVLIEIVPGGFCSIHRHDHQDNGFVVISGVLRLVIDPRAPSPHAISLVSGSHELVRAGTEHQFHACYGQVVRALEIYTSHDDEPPRELDIVRFGEGGVLS